MKISNYFFILFTIILTIASCSTTPQKSAVPTEPRVMATASIQKLDTSEKNKLDNHSAKNIYKSYKMEFWDSINPRLYPRTNPVTHEQQPQRGKSRDAFSAGRRFSAIIYTLQNNDSATNDTSSAFLQLIAQDTKEHDVSVTPFVVAGNYFQMLTEVVQNKNPQTGRIDEKTLKKGIDAIDGLKNYINATLQESQDINLNVMLQKMSHYADSIKSTYHFCSQQQDPNNYQKLHQLLQSIETDIFSEN